MLLCNKFQPFFELTSNDPDLLKKHKKIRYVILIGGRGGAKSHALGTWVNIASFNDGWGFYYTRWTMKSAEKSVIPEFKKVSTSIGNNHKFAFKQTQVINLETDTVIDYSGLKPQSNQSKGDSKSLSNKNVFIVEEAEDVPNFEDFDRVDNSIRTIDHKNLVILCLNQGHINHWIYQEFFTEERDDTIIIETTYLDNLKFLDDSFIRKAERLKKRDLTRYNHVYLNEWKKDVDGALWLDSDISPYRITSEDFEEVELREVVVGFDPGVTDTEKPKAERTKETGNDPDEDGIVITAKGKNKEYYVLKDKSRRGKRSEIAQTLVDLYHKHDLNYIVIEKNNGGDWIPALIKTVDKYVRVKMVTATKGKVRRAQPIQSLYENGEVHHVGYLSELEHEMTTWVDDQGLPSPNRMDALVWGLTHLSGKKEILVAG